MLVVKSLYLMSAFMRQRSNKRAGFEVQPVHRETDVQMRDGAPANDKGGKN